MNREIKFKVWDKAKELANKYYWIFGDGYLSEEHIQCALIAVEEIINANPSLPILSESGNLYSDIQESKAYWQEVKNEILKLSNQKP